ncbi:ParB N-terminal domain-containing protein [Singulisphaera sp. PoT]|uniref:ParB N-terminal domain-containing protein n=1 Tax=Singulisphaera sp. PoT TaxID=3411797 RepID=UPI003BF57CFE
MPRIQLRSILMDEYTQVRVSHDEGARADYADAYRSGEQLPRPVVFQDAAGRLRMADGHHRARAALDAGLSELDCDVRQGEARDAMIYAIRANGRNGLRWSTADKRRVINLLLDDPEFEECSDRAIARLAGVDNKTVAAVRRPRTREEIPQNPSSTVSLEDELARHKLAIEGHASDIDGMADALLAAGDLLDADEFDRWLDDSFGAWAPAFREYHRRLKATEAPLEAVA